MELATTTAGASGAFTPDALPARRVDAHGRVHVDARAVLALAVPLMMNSAVQIVLNLTDMWFIGHISTRALAAVGAVQWLGIAVILVLGGVGMAVQTVVAQSHGARQYTRAAQAAWTALWATACVIPAFLAVGLADRLILAPFGFESGIAELAGAFWRPRVGGAFFGAALWAMFGFFNGIARPRVTLLVSLATALANVIFNELYIFRLGFGIAGSAWATTTAQALGLILAVMVFVSAPLRREYHSHQEWRPRRAALWEQLRLGFPMGLLPAADLLGFSVFQMMQVRLGTVDGAATQMVMMLTSIAYMPGFGIASAGTTLVGHSIGAGDRAWAMRLGTRIVIAAAVLMGGIGLALALGGPWILPLFTGSHDAEAAAAAALGVRLLWLQAAYQFFDGLNLGASQCLRGAGDATVPVLIVLPLSWFVFVPLAHILTFAPGQGWVHFLPQLGWGAVGGWIAVLVHIILLGTLMLLRWRSGAWQHIRI